MTLPGMSFQAAVLILAVVVVRAVALHHLPKRVFLALWGLVALRLLVPVALPSGLSVFNWLAWPAVMQPGAFYGGAGQAAGQAANQAAPTGAAMQAGFPWFAVWLAVAMLCLALVAALYGRSLAGFRASLPVHSPAVDAWLRAHPLRRRVTVRASDRVGTPLTYGLLRPVILLPAGMPQAGEALEMVLLHEWVHIRRWDAAKKLVLALCVCLHWCNPLVWVMALLAGRDLELACDEDAVRRLGLACKRGYAMMLVDLASRRPGFITLHNSFGKNAIEERVGSIMRAKPTKRLALLASVLVVAGMALAFGTSALAAAADTASDGSAKPGWSTGEVCTYEQAKEQWKEYGITIDPFSQVPQYEGKQVRFFVDNRTRDGGFCGTVFDMTHGEGYFVARRDDTGKLVSIDEITAEEADRIAHWRP